MSLNHRRNIYTLGNIGAKENLKRRQQSDPFEKDPFKIQSYNFRYAERPSFPLAPLQSRINDSNKANDCKTFFYNYDFPNNNANIRKSLVLQNDERVLNLTNFQEYRRKKFLQEAIPSRLKYQSSKTISPKPYESKLLNIYNGNRNSRCSPSLVMKPLYMQTKKPNCSFTKYENLNTRQDIQIKRPLTPASQSGIHKTVSSTLSDFNAKRSRGLSSGCEININIKSLEHNSVQDNVNIKIETDSICRNLNLNTANNQNTFAHKDKKLERFYSSETFVIDKNLTKYTSKCHDIQEIGRKKDSERIKELTSIYSSQLSKKPLTERNIKSNERLPSLIPAGLNFDNYHIMNNNFTRSKSLLETPKSKDNNCITNNNLQNIRYNNLNSSTKKCHTPLYASLHSLSSTLNRSEFRKNVPLQMRSNAKLPINVNINVYADKLKL